MRALTLAVLLAACGGGDDGGRSGDGGGGGGDDEPGGNASVFDPSVTRVAIEIDYETGEEPYTGQVAAFGDTFDLTKTNMQRVFGSRTLELPTTVAAMQDIGAIADEELTVQDLLALAEQHRDQRNSAGTHTYYVIFVSGYYTTAAGPQTGVLGVSIGDTGVLAMFKDVIRSTDSIVFPNLARFVEQSTLVHELGHAVGLVDNGVPLVTPHKDAEHGAHCTNESCVMYWLNEGASDAAEFARTYITSGNSVLFGDECLADVDALQQQ